MIKKVITLKNGIFAFLCIALLSCTTVADQPTAQAEKTKADIKMYEGVWDSIINKGKLDLFNENNFQKNVVFHMTPTDVVGIDSARAYYRNFITGFSNIRFEIRNIFGDGDQLVKHWVFTGVHTGMFFGMPATNKPVKLQGATIVRMEDGKIAEEQDFFDNLDLMTQLGQLPQ